MTSSRRPVADQAAPGQPDADAPPTSATRSERKERVLDARSLRALAHPLRMRMLSMLRADGPATATGLAARVGESSGTTSWHLRQLAEHGFIEQDPDRGNRRERWWRAAQQSTRLEWTQDFAADPETRGAFDVYMHEILSSYFHRAAAFLAEEQEWIDRGWADASTMSDWRLHLTPAEAGELLHRVEELIESYRRDERPGDEAFLVELLGFPAGRQS